MANPFGDVEVTKNPFGDEELPEGNPYGDPVEPTKSVLSTWRPAMAQGVVALKESLEGNVESLAAAESSFPERLVRKMKEPAIHPGIAATEFAAEELVNLFRDDSEEALEEKRGRLRQNRMVMQEAQTDIDAAVGTPSEGLIKSPREYGVDIVTNTTRSGMGLALSLALRKNVLPAIALGGAQAEAFSEMQGLDKGGSYADAESAGDVSGLAEAGFELLPVSKLMAGIGKDGFKKLVKDYIVAETLTELPTTALDDIAQQVYITPDRPLGEFLQEALKNQITTLVTTPVSAGVQGGTAAVVGKGIDTLTGRGNTNTSPEQPPPAPDLTPPPAQADMFQEEISEEEGDDIPNDPGLDITLAENDDLLRGFDALIEAGQNPVEGLVEAKQEENAAEQLTLFETKNMAVEGLDDQYSAKDSVVSREVAKDDKNWVSDPNSAVARAARRVTRGLGIPQEWIGKAWGEVDLADIDTTQGPVVLQVGEDSEVRPAHALAPMMQDLYNFAAEFNPRGVYVVLPENLPRGVQGAHLKHNGIHYITPRHLNDLTNDRKGEPRVLGQHNPTAYQDFVSSMGHEFGHSLLVDHVLEGLNIQQQQTILTEMETGKVTDATLALLPPPVGKLVQKWMKLREAALTKKISGRAFGALWFSPTKLGNATKLRNNLYNVGKSSARNSWSAMDLVNAFGGSEQLTFWEFAAEQLPKYLHTNVKPGTKKVRWNTLETTKALPGATAVHQSYLDDYFAPLLEKLKAFFGKLKEKNWVGPQEEFVDFLDYLQTKAEGVAEVEVTPQSERAALDWGAKETKTLVRAALADMFASGKLDKKEYLLKLEQMREEDGVEDVFNFIEGEIGELRYDTEKSVIPANFLTRVGDWSVTIDGVNKLARGTDEISLAQFRRIYAQASAAERKFLMKFMQRNLANLNGMTKQGLAAFMQEQIPAIVLDHSQDPSLRSDVEYIAQYDYPQVRNLIPGIISSKSRVITFVAPGTTIASDHLGAGTVGWSRIHFSTTATYIASLQSTLMQKFDRFQEMSEVWQRSYERGLGMRESIEARSDRWLELARQAGDVKAEENYLAEREEALAEWEKQQSNVLAKLATLPTERQTAQWEWMQEVWFPYFIQIAVQSIAQKVGEWEASPLVRVATALGEGHLQGWATKEEAKAKRQAFLKQQLADEASLKAEYAAGRLDQRAFERGLKSLREGKPWIAGAGARQLYEQLEKFLKARYGAVETADGNWLEFSVVGEQNTPIYLFNTSKSGLPYNFDLKLGSVEEYADLLGLPTSYTYGDSRYYNPSSPKLQALASRVRRRDGLESEFFTQWFGEWNHAVMEKVDVVDVAGEVVGEREVPHGGPYGSSAVVDAVGRPLVMWMPHNFNDRHQRATSNRGEALQRAMEMRIGKSDTMLVPLYINLRNPLIVSAQGVSLTEAQEQVLMDKARRAKQDGVLIVNAPTMDSLQGIHVLWGGGSDVDTAKLAPGSTPESRGFGKGNVTFMLGGGLRYDTSTPAGAQAGRIERMLKKLAPENLKKVAKSLYWANNFHTRLLQLEQLAHIHPWIEGLQTAAQLQAKYEEVKAALVEGAFKVADSMSWKSPATIKVLYDVTRAEFKSGVHLTKLVKKGMYDYTHEATPELYAAFKAQGVDVATEAGKAQVTMYLDAKNAIQTQMNALERVLVGKRLVKYAGDQQMMKERAAEVMMQFHEMRKMPYWPQQRYGRYHVTVAKKNELGTFTRVYHEAFDSIAEQKAAYDSAQKKYKSGVRVSRTELSEGAAIVQMLPANFIEDAVELLELNETDAAALQALSTPLGNTAMKAFDATDRVAVGGGTDFFRNFADFTLHTGHLIAKMEFRGLFDQAIKELKVQEKTLWKGGGSAEQLALMAKIQDEVQRHKEQLFNPSGEFHNVRAFTSLLYLAGNVTTALLNLTTLLQTFGWMANNLSAVEATAIMGKSVHYATQSALNTTWAKTPEELQLARIVEMAYQRGVINQAYNYALSGQASSNVLHRAASASVLGKVARGLVDNAGMYMFKKTEAAVRLTTVLALAQMLQKQGKFKLDDIGTADLFTEATKQTRLLAGNYLSSNRPSLLAGKTMSLFTIFMTYSQLMAFQAYGGMEMGQRRQAKLTGETVPAYHSYTAYTVLLYLALAGIEGLPGAESLLDILEAVAKAMGWTSDLRKDLRLFVKDITGADPNLMMHGLGHDVGGYDISGRLGLGRMVPGTDRVFNSNANSAGEYYGSLLMSMAGVFGGTLKSFYDVQQVVYSEAGGGLPWDVRLTHAAQKVPGVTGSAANALEWGRVGARGPRGGILLLDEEGRPRSATPTELAMRAAGVRPTELTGRQEQSFTERNVAAYWTNRRGDLLQAYKYANLISEDPAMTKDVLVAITQFNQQLAKQGDEYRRAFGITGKALAQYRRRTRKVMRGESLQRGSRRERLVHEAVNPAFEHEGEE